MRKSTLLLWCASGALVFSGAAYAHGGPGGGGGFGGRSGGEFSQGNATGASAGGPAYQTSNSPFSRDRDQGLERAEDRMSTQGLDHSKASDTQAQRRNGSRSGIERRAPQRESDR